MPAIPLAALRPFEAAARLGGSRATRRLSVSTRAVSHRLAGGGHEQARSLPPLPRRMSGSLLVMLAAILTVIVVWFRNPPGWTDVLGMIAMVGALILQARVVASMWP
jgi:hypothetical protein